MHRRKRLPKKLKLLIISCLACSMALLIPSLTKLENFGLAQTQPTLPMGINLAGVSERSPAFAFTDVIRQGRRWGSVSNPADQNVPIDGNGWPTTDAAMELIDLPPGFDIGGTYKLSFGGQATIRAYAGSRNYAIANQIYNGTTNITTADIVVPSGVMDLVLQFTATRRTVGSAQNTGITNVKCIRPGFAADGSQVFTTPYIASLNSFSVFRAMELTGTNNQTDANWSDRTLPSFASQAEASGGAAWEYVIQLANQAGKDVWINIPAMATDDYVRQLATLFKNNLRSGLRLYIEYSNELWNPQFSQARYNQQQAQADASLRFDGSTDVAKLSARRVGKRIAEISNIFKAQYGAAAINTTVRPVLAWQVGDTAGFQEQLRAIQQLFGTPSQFIFGIADAPFMHVGDGLGVSQDTSTVDAILRGYTADSDQNRASMQSATGLATSYNLKHLAYEGGPHSPSRVNVTNLATANRDARMKDVLLRDIGTNWFGTGGDLFMYYNNFSRYDSTGQWGLSESVFNQNTPKWQAIQQLASGSTPSPTPTATATPTPTPTATPTPTPTATATPTPTPTSTPTPTPTLSPTPTPTPTLPTAPSGNLVTAIANGNWTSPSVWSNGRIPTSGDDIFIPQGRMVQYDANSGANIHTITLFGTLQFTPAQNTLLRVGVLKIGADARDNSASCAGKLPTAPSVGSLIVGLPGAPIPRGVSATIQLVPFSDLNANDTPGLINCGGRFTAQGATIQSPWTRITANALKTSSSVSVAADISDWRVGDRIIIVGTNNAKRSFSDGAPSYRFGAFTSETEERVITGISGKTITFNAPLIYNHEGVLGNFPEVANLTRTVLVQSADTSVSAKRGHTMYHAFSSGSIAYAQFDGLGKEATLGRYPIHFHRTQDTMRGASVVGVAVTNGDNKFITIHDTDYVVLRDNVGYRTNTTGYFLEDGTEVYNVLDHNLAVNALDGTPSPTEELSFMTGKGFGFWWANGRNTLINNQSAESDEFGYFYEIDKVNRYRGTTFARAEHLVAPMRNQSGVEVNTQINKVPFFRFEGNSCHTEKTWCMNVNGGDWTLDRPSVLKSFNAWTTHYPITIASNGVLVEGATSNNSNYGPTVKFNYAVAGGANNVTYRNLRVSRSGVLGFGSLGAGTNVNWVNSEFTDIYEAWTPNGNWSQVPGVTLSGVKFPAGTLFQTTSANQIGNAGPTFINDYYGPGVAAKIIHAKANLNDGLSYGSDSNLLGPNVKVARSPNNTNFAIPNPIDDLAPATAITSLGAVRDNLAVRLSNGTLTLEGTTTDNGSVSGVSVNGVSATPIVPDFSRWRVTLQGLRPGAYTVVASARDTAGNVEQNSHALSLVLQ